MIPAQIETLLTGHLTITGNQVKIVNETSLRNQLIDQLVYQAIFGDDAIKPAARWIIWQLAQVLGIRSSSIHSSYMARGRNLIDTQFTVPAMNFRGMTYDTARALFQAANNTQAKAFICELARGEMGYSDQSPAEYVIAILAAAIREGYEGPVFIQGDHFQTKCSRTVGVPDPGEMEALMKLIEEAIEAGFYNIDIDASTLVDLAKPDVADQQAPNIHYTSELMQQIRNLEPAGVTISVGGEIGHIGGKNSTVEDFTTFVDGVIEAAPKMPLMSKISVATGTSHGGVVNPDGTLAAVNVDFSILQRISTLARQHYQIGGAVQHGASTLPDDMLHQFPPTGTLEIHLATGFQNLLMDHPAFPKELLTAMYAWLDTAKISEKEPDQTTEQFHYKLRKKCWGQFKKATWDLPESVKDELRTTLRERFELIFKELNVVNTAAVVEEYTPVHEVLKEIVDFAIPAKIIEVQGLSD